MKIEKKYFIRFFNKYENLHYQSNFAKSCYDLKVIDRQNKQYVSIKSRRASFY